MESLATIARLSERIGQLESINRALESQVAFLSGDGIDTVAHVEWMLQRCLDKMGDDPYLHDTDDVSDYIVQALSALGSVTHGDAEAEEVYLDELY
jgi:hypothetical protein